MKQRLLQFVTNLLILSGITLIVFGAGSWWRQSRVEAATVGDERHVLLAQTLNGRPPAVGPNASPAPAQAGLQNAASDGLGAPQVLPETEIRGAPAALPNRPASPLPIPSPLPRGSERPPLSTEPTAEGAPEIDPFPPARSAPARLAAPEIGLEASVVEMGWATRTDGNGNAYSEWVVPDFAAGWHINSMLPGHGGNTVISGHNNIAGEVFARLADLDLGTEITLESDGVPYTYVVEEKYIVAEKGQPIEVRRENNRFIEPTDDERLTLVSCWPYESNTHRVVVIARPLIPRGPLPSSQGDSLN